MGDSKTAGKLLIGGGYALFLAFAFFLLFYHLDNHLLWGDEGETAVLAKNVTRFGVPRTFDGTNYILLHNQRDENRDHVWVWSPWLQEYLAAGSFVLFGPTTWAARAPFALIGWCSLVALALVAYKIYRSHWVALASVVLLGASEVFLLHARQCRYYPISILGEILLVYGVHQLFARNRRGIWFAALALILQFYSNYIVVVANLPALFILAGMLRRQGKPAMLRVVAVLVVLMAAALPLAGLCASVGTSQRSRRRELFPKGLEVSGGVSFSFYSAVFSVVAALRLDPASR
jgi:4-amino-4-deoxy-L-arabinose transferase-like glycosyltransferase